MNEPLECYLRFLELERGYAANTLRTYRRILTDFLRVVSPNGRRIGRIGREEVGNYIPRLRGERGNSGKTIRLKLQAIKSFLGYAREHEKGFRSAPLGKNDFRYKVEHKEVESLSEQQIGRLLEAAEEQGRQAQSRLQSDAGKTTLRKKQLFACRRDLCLLTLLASTGLRIAEALGIRFSDIDFLDKSIQIVGKGKRLRTVFFDLERLESTLTEYLELRRSLSVAHEYLFVSIKEYRPLGSRGFQKLLKGYLAKAKLSISVTPHTLRHCFATVTIEKGGNIKAVSQILGHANCSITIDLYTHLSNEHLREVMQLCNPLASTEIPLEERLRMRRQHLAYLGRTG
jgi:site-specific recombinase XerD